MKNAFFSFLAIISLSRLLIAQTAAVEPPKIWIGPHAGIDIANLAYDPEPTGITLKSKVGIAAGAGVNFMFSEHIGIISGLTYVQKGGGQEVKFNIFGQDITSTGSIDFSFLQVPLLAKAQFGIDKVKPFLFIGPEVGFKLSATTTAEADGQDTTADIPDDEVASTNFSIVAGTGVGFELNQTTAIVIAGMYDFGLTNLNAHYDGTNDKQKIFTRDIRFMVGLHFGLGGTPSERRLEDGP